MDFGLHPSTISAISWLGAFTSIVAAYCLSNHRVNEGRVVGSIAATIWGIYAILSDQPSILVVDVVYLVIYAQAWLKFKRKRDGYRKISTKQDDIIEHQAVEITRLRNRLRKFKKMLSELDEE